jgi:serine/threonine-protein kinase
VVNAERLAELFADAVERDAAGRRQVLAAAASEDPELGAELERLLAAASGGSVLDRSPWVGVAGETVGADDAETDFPGAGAEQLPERIGPYRVVRELGRGGMGRVFLAVEETEHFRRDVALKVIDRPAGDAEAVRRFRHEVRILASLDHPGIARFLGGGRAADGNWFLALERIEGENLIAHAASRRLTVRERVELFAGAVDAVEFAHQRGIVHRDLKPSNLLVGADGRPRLLDFGISKLIEPDGEEAATLTRAGTWALTPAYASPEQFRGERVTPASDVYSLGVLLYELLAGRRPFEEGDSSVRALEHVVLETDPAPPSVAARQKTAPREVTGERAASAVTTSPREIGGDLDAVCLKALRKRPQDRYDTAGALAADLRRYLDRRPVAARRGGTRYRLGRFASRYRGKLAIAAAVALALAAIVFAVGTRRQAERLLRAEPPQAEPFPFDDLRPVPELQRAFADRPDSVEIGASLALALADAGRAEEAALVVARLRQIPERENDPLTDYAEAIVAMKVDEPQRALVLFTRARDGALQAERGELIGQIRASRGRLLATLGEREQARAEMELARADFERAGDQASLARVLNDLAIEYLTRGEMERGEALLDEALAATRAAGRRPATILVNLGLLTQIRGRPDLAEQRLREAVEVLRDSGSARRLGDALAPLADVLHDLGRPEEAREVAEEAITLLREAKEPTSLANALCGRAFIDLDAVELEEIDATAAEMEQIAGSVGRSVALGLARHVRGRAAAARGDLPLARQHLGAARDLLVASGDQDMAAQAELALAVIEHDAGNPAAALLLLDAAVARLDAGAAHGAAFLAETLRARISAESGQALEARRRLVSLGDENARSPSISRRLAFLAARAAVARAEGNIEAAQNDLEAALRLAHESGRAAEAERLERDLSSAVGRQSSSPLPDLSLAPQEQRSGERDGGWPTMRSENPAPGWLV